MWTESKFLTDIFILVYRIRRVASCLHSYNDNLTFVFSLSHGNKEVFSCHGIQLAVDWFRQRGHTQITVFVPQWRKESSRPDARITGTYTVIYQYIYLYMYMFFSGYCVSLHDTCT